MVTRLASERFSWRRWRCPADAICCRVSRHCWGRLGLARLRVSALTREVLVTTTTPSTALVTVQPAFTDAERLHLAGYRGLIREV